MHAQYLSYLIHCVQYMSRLLYAHPITLMAAAQHRRNKFALLSSSAAGIMDSSPSLLCDNHTQSIRNPCLARLNISQPLLSCVSTSTFTLLSLEKVLVSSAYLPSESEYFLRPHSQFTVIVSRSLPSLDCAYLRTSTYKAARR